MVILKSGLNRFVPPSFTFIIYFLDLPTQAFFRKLLQPGGAWLNHAKIPKKHAPDFFEK
ncbi:hypothetical protein [Pseudoramibacter alactolyticus]|uniref:hypothetical protein n=1 Tax=Pseudoramibacter alactolyticus TaxID=113287 RepID=UPI0028F0BAA7|nr:hypothetical protein [Pseudoramibacter alactolyticus]